MAKRDDYSSHIPLSKLPVIPEHHIWKQREDGEFCTGSRDHIHCDCYHGKYQFGQEIGVIGTCCLCGTSKNEDELSAPHPGRRIRAQGADSGLAPLQDGVSQCRKQHEQATQYHDCDDQRRRTVDRQQHQPPRPRRHLPDLGQLQRDEDQAE